MSEDMFGGTVAFNPYEEPIFCFWGNGHTPETAPSRQGWKFRQEVEGTWVVARRNESPCAVVTRSEDAAYRVVFYASTPQEVANTLRKGGEMKDGLNRPELLPNAAPGLKIIEVIKRLQRP